MIGGSGCVATKETMQVASQVTLIMTIHLFGERRDISGCYYRTFMFIGVFVPIDEEVLHMWTASSVLDFLVVALVRLLMY